MPQDALLLVRELMLKAKKLRHAKLVVCPSWPLAGFIMSSRKGKVAPIQLGAQNISVYETGAHTGEVSAVMAAKLGVHYVIVGHSERRALGESDEMVAKKVNAALICGITPIICVGESERDQHGLYLGLLKKQILGSLAGIQKNKISNVVIAYEPVYAVGGKKPLEASEMEQMYLYIRKVLTDMFDDEGNKVPILYGGTVFAENVQDFFRKANVDGVLLGRASASAKEMIAIASLA